MQEKENVRTSWGIVKDVWRLLSPYFTTHDRGSITLPILGRFRLQERWIAFFLLGTVILVELLQVGIIVRLSYFNRDFFNAIQAYDKPTFWRLLFSVFLFWSLIYVIIAILQYVLAAFLTIRWRRWLTEHFIDKWVTKDTFYKMQLLGLSPDNPDQRIAFDIEAFISTTLSLGVSFLSTVSTLISFSVVLWSLSAELPIPFTNIYLPGFLVWFCLFYTGAATYMIHLIGHSLGHLNFQQQRYEADFRFSLARLREYNEPVALMQGYNFEKDILKNRFHYVIANFLNIVRITKRLISFRSGYVQLSVVIPYVVMSSYYFSKLIPLGVMSQTSGAFNSVIGAMSFFASSYERLAEYKSIVDRLTGFKAAIFASEILNTEALPNFQHSYKTNTHEINLSNVTIFRPNHEPLLSIPHLHITQGEWVLISGPSGIGKTTLFRTLMRSWPFVKGDLNLPPPQEIMSLPQKPYFPLGTLRSCLIYPGSDCRDKWANSHLNTILERVGLAALINRLDIEPPQHSWSLSLSGGEQQRLAIARALLHKPLWILMDESTSAIDEDMEHILYNMLRSHLPETTILSISHRSGLKAYHNRFFSFKESEQNGGIAYRLTESSLPESNHV
jgi:putative ATP-binding cassette transporter